MSPDEPLAPAAALVERATPNLEREEVLRLALLDADEMCAGVLSLSDARAAIRYLVGRVNAAETDLASVPDPPAIADRATAPAPLEELIAKWRRYAGTALKHADEARDMAARRVEDYEQGIASAFKGAADDLEAALRAVPSGREQEKP